MQSIRHWIVQRIAGLWPRMALAISLGFLALFVAFSALGERALRDSTERILEERMVVAQMTANHLDGVLQRAVAELDQAHRFADFDPADPDLEAEAEILISTYGRVGDFASGIAFLDSGGRVILSHPPDLYPSGTDLSGLPHVAQAIELRSVTISDPFLDPLSQRPVAAVTVPTYDGSRFLGLLSGLVDLSRQAVLAPLQQAATVGRTGHAALVDRQGRNLASTLSLPFLAPGEHRTFYRWGMAQRQPVIDTVPFELEVPGEERGELHVMALAPLRMAPWGAAVGGDADETFAGVRRLRLGLLVLSAIALAGVWAATLVGTRRLMQPVQRLTEGARRIAEGDLYTPLEGPQEGEIGALATTLECMRRQLLASIGQLADWNETLEARVAERTEQLDQQQAQTQQLLRRAIAAQEEERARLSRELHDELAQMLTAVKLSLDRLARALPPQDAAARERLQRAQALTEQALADLRHIMVALRPGVLDSLGLIPALGWVADHTLRPLGVAVTIEPDGLQERLPGEIETILFRIAQEAMSNVARHSQARHLAIRLSNGDSQIIMTLSDDGQGFVLSSVPAAPDHIRGLGLATMQERASLAGGRVTVESAPGQGATVHVVVPLSVSVMQAES